MFLIFFFLAFELGIISYRVARSHTNRQLEELQTKVGVGRHTAREDLLDEPRRVVVDVVDVHGDVQERRVAGVVEADVRRRDRARVRRPYQHDVRVSRFSVQLFDRLLRMNSRRKSRD